ncbi:MAG: flagellar export chaperone FliS [Actinomycetia bacterium]|nr:flagellar export chaperone FliS [Actinomycetes bacterium]
MSPSNTGLANYAQASAVTASPHEVVRMAFERILTACARAEAAEQGRNASWLQTFHDETVRAQAILVELSAGLSLQHPDREVVDLAERLDSLYRYVITQLAQANMHKSSGPLQAVRMVVDGLRDAWASNPP